eukprot:TRINITY_DN6182_c0_g1_i2.p1 TRINITY_DN6182_c0_g1~~TRINITY_DN6182_c0_g1_i2.p1  ORF type:complete len:258 (+),score=41.40 TRINITY_DN6182_c0_g1_i2:72-845(+)
MVNLEWEDLGADVHNLVFRHALLVMNENSSAKYGVNRYKSQLFTWSRFRIVCKSWHRKMEELFPTVVTELEALDLALIKRSEASFFYITNRFKYSDEVMENAFSKMASSNNIEMMQFLLDNKKVDRKFGEKILKHKKTKLLIDSNQYYRMWYRRKPQKSDALGIFIILVIVVLEVILFALNFNLSCDKPLKWFIFVSILFQLPCPLYMYLLKREDRSWHYSDRRITLGLATAGFAWYSLGIARISQSKDCVCFTSWI